MDEFIYVLIAVAVIFALLFAFSTPLAEIMTDEGVSPGNDVVIASLSGGSVGAFEGNVKRVVNFGTFDLGRLHKYTIISLPDLSIKSSLTDSKKGEFSIDMKKGSVSENMKQLKLSFKLRKTNQLGNLVIKWNGYEIFNDVANLVEYDIEIPLERVKNVNSLEVYAEGPGLMFWATNFYELSDFEVYAMYGPEKIIPFDLKAEEIENWDRGEVFFFATGDDDARLDVKLNGRIVYSKKNIAGEGIRFDINYTSARMKAGTNLLSFKADNGQLTLHNAKMKIITIDNEGSTIVHKINVTESVFSLLKRHGAYADINIKTVYKKGTLALRINENEINVPANEEGKITVFIDSEKFVQGENSVEFSGTGAWEIGNIRIYSKR